MSEKVTTSVNWVAFATIVFNAIVELAKLFVNS